MASETAVNGGGGGVRNSQGVVVGTVLRFSTVKF